MNNRLANLKRNRKAYIKEQNLLNEIRLSEENIRLKEEEELQIQLEHQNRVKKAEQELKELQAEFPIRFFLYSFFYKHTKLCYSIFAAIIVGVCVLFTT